MAEVREAVLPFPLSSYAFPSRGIHATSVELATKRVYLYPYFPVPAVPRTYILVEFVKLVLIDKYSIWFPYLSKA